MAAALGVAADMAVADIANTELDSKCSQGGEKEATQAYTTCYVEGPPSEKIGRGLDALPETPACSGDPQRSEGPPSEKIGRGLDALPETPACSGDPQRSEGPTTKPTQ